MSRTWTTGKDAVCPSNALAGESTDALKVSFDEFPICSVDLFVHQKWLEPRLELPEDIFEEGDDYVTLPPEFFDNLWQPDPYFLNSKLAGKLRPYIDLNIP